MPKNLYYWFKENDITTIQKQILIWLTALYLSSYSHEKVEMQDELYPPIFKEILSLIDRYFGIDSKEVLAGNLYNTWDLDEKREEELKESYHVACIRHYRK